MARSTDSASSSSDNEAHATEAPRSPSEHTSTAPDVSPTHTEDDPQQKERGRHPRPKMGSRNSSTMIVPRTSTQIEDVEDSFSPDDARAMSPRRNSDETDAMEEATRYAVREQARMVQLGLLEIAESIELVKADHDKLEKQNLALQDYIGGLTRSMSKSSQTKGGKSSSK